MLLHRRNRDGIHWSSKANRLITNIIVTQITSIMGQQVNIKEEKCKATTVLDKICSVGLPKVSNAW